MSKVGFVEFAAMQGVRVTDDLFPDQLAWKLLTAQKQHAQLLGEAGMKMMYTMYLNNFMTLQGNDADISKLLKVWDEAWKVAKLCPVAQFEVAQILCLSCHEQDEVRVAGAASEDAQDGE